MSQASSTKPTSSIPDFTIKGENEKIANVIKINLEAVDKATKYLRSKADVEEGFDGKRRVEYFQGAHIVKLLMDSKYTADFGGSEEGAIKFLSIMSRRGYFVRGEVARKATRSQLAQIKEHPINVFRIDDGSVYVWQIMESPFWNIVLGAGVIIGGFLMCMLPLWPGWMRTGVTYISYGILSLLGLLFGILIVRAIVFCLVILCSFGKVYFWIYPNLNEEVENIMDSFRPMYSLEYADSATAAQGEKKTQ